MPAKYADRRRGSCTPTRGDDVWIVRRRRRSRTSGSTRSPAGPRRSTASTRPSFDEMRAGCYDVARAREGHERGRRARVRCASRRSRRSRAGCSSALDDKDLALAVVQAYNDWHIDEWCGTYPGPLHPDGAARALGPRAVRGRDPPRRGEGLPLAHVHREPGDARATRASTTTHWDPMWRALVDEGTILNIHLGSSGQLAVTAPDAPIDVMITLQPMNICMAAADLVWSRVFKEFPDLARRAVRGRHRLDPVLPRPARPHLRHAPPVDRPGLRRPHCRPTCSASTSSRASSPTRSASQLRDDIGIDNICWEQDYPHSDSSWPNAPEELAAMAATLRRARRRDRQDHARERDALVPLRSVRAPPRGAVHGRRAAGRGRGPRRVGPLDGQGPLRDGGRALTGRARGDGRPRRWRNRARASSGAGNISS